MPPAFSLPETCVDVDGRRLSVVYKLHSVGNRQEPEVVRVYDPADPERSLDAPVVAAAEAEFRGWFWYARKK